MMDPTNPENRTDDELLMQLALGDAVAFDTLLARHRSAVFRFVRRMVDGDSAIAEDLTQECFLRLWRGRAMLQPGAAQVRTLIVTIARNLVLDHHKRKGVQTQPLLDSDERQQIASHTDSPETVLLRQELYTVVTEAREALPDELQRILHLRGDEGLSYEEIATRLGCPVGTVKSRLHQARLRLQQAARSYLAEEPSTRHLQQGEERHGTTVRISRKETTYLSQPAPRVVPRSGYIYTIQEETT